MPDAANHVTVVATLRAAKGKADALAALLVEQCAVIRKTEPGCLAYRIHRSTTDPDAFLFYEIYVDEAAFDAHRASPHLAQYRKRRQDEALLDGGIDVKVYRALSE
jgi:quinol monooxygenase YgiN